jgi:hypothetical protein
LTAITFNNEIFDTDTMHDTLVNPSRITFKTAGIYLVIFQGMWMSSIATDPTAKRLFYIKINGTSNIGVTGLAGIDESMMYSVQTIQKFNVNDYVEALVSQNTGLDLNMLAYASYAPIFSAVWLGNAE